MVTGGLSLVVPIKPLRAAKSRLRGAADRGRGNGSAHAKLVTAVALDTISAARQAGIADVVIVTNDPELTATFTAEGVEVVPDVPDEGLNAALRYCDGVLRTRSPRLRVGALQADLPALRPADLAAAIRSAGESRAFCPDRQGSGTTLLLGERGKPLDPRFGPDSALAHTLSGALPLRGPWDSLRCDVDTEADLLLAAELGVGPRTAACMHAATGLAGPDLMFPLVSSPEQNPNYE